MPPKRVLLDDCPVCGADLTQPGALYIYHYPKREDRKKQPPPMRQCAECRKARSREYAKTRYAGVPKPKKLVRSGPYKPDPEKDDDVARAIRERERVLAMRRLYGESWWLHVAA